MGVLWGHDSAHHLVLGRGLGASSKPSVQGSQIPLMLEAGKARGWEPRPGGICAGDTES